MMKNVFTLMKLFPLLAILAMSWTNASGQAYPFPQDVNYARGLEPGNANSSHVQDAYEAWVSKYVTSNGVCTGRRVIFDYFPGTGRGKEDKSRTVSEGIAYGMLIAAYMGDRSLFNDFWSYYKANRNGNGVMHWRIDNTCNVTGRNGASDAELDVAMALIVASHQWQSDVYLNDAKMMIRTIREHEFEGNILKPGDQFGGSGLLCPSYFSPAYYRVFADLDPGYGEFWRGAADRGYEIIDAADGSTGLVPDWTTAQGTVSTDPAANGYEDQGRNFIFDAIRTPFRSGIDYLWHGDTKALAYCEKISGWLTGKYNSANDIGSKFATQLSDAEEGTELEPYTNNTFLGCFGVGLMATEMDSELSFLEDIYQANVNLIPQDGEYFNASFKLMSLMVMTGNFYLPPPDACDSPELGDTRSLCEGNITLESGLANRDFVWRRNGTVVSGETGNSITASQAGTYEVLATDAEGCVRRDKVEVVSETVTADFTAVAGPGGIIVNNTSLGGVSNYYWTITGEDLASDLTFTEETPEITGLDNGLYEVTLRVTNEGFNCSQEDSKTLSVNVGDGEGIGLDDFNDAFNRGLSIYTYGDAVNPFEPFPKTYCSAEIAEADGDKDCDDHRCSYIDIVATGNADATWSSFEISFNDASTPEPVGTFDLSDVPYVSIKVSATKPLTANVLIANDGENSSAIPIDITTEEQIFFLDFSEELPTGVTAFDMVDKFILRPYADDLTYDGTISIDYVILGAGSLELPNFDLKKDEYGFTDYSNYLPDYYPNDPIYDTCSEANGGCYGAVRDWERNIDLCAGEAKTINVNACTANEIRWYRGDSYLQTGESIDLESSGLYYVDLVNSSGVYRDSVLVNVASAPEADFAYVTEDYGKGYRFQMNATNFDSFEWDYGIPVSELDDEDAINWEEGYNYYQDEGTYEVCLTVENSECPDVEPVTVCKDIDVQCEQDAYGFNFVSSTHNIVEDTIEACGGETLEVSADVSYLSGSVTEPITGPDAITNYVGWFGFDGGTEMSSTETVSFEPTDFSGYLKIETENKCGVKTADSIFIQVTPGPVAEVSINSVKTEQEIEDGQGPLYTVFETTWAGDNATYAWYVDDVLVEGAEGLEAHIDFVNYGGAGIHNVRVDVTTPCGDASENGDFEICAPEVDNLAFTITGDNMDAALNYTGGDFDENYYTYTWIIDDEEVDVDDNPYTHTFETEGAHTINLVINNGCEDFTGTEDEYTAQEECVAIDPVDVEITESVLEVCEDETGVVYTAGLLEDVNYKWSVPSDAEFTKSTDGNSITVDFGSTSDNVEVVISNGCSEETASVAVSVKETPEAEFTYSVTGTDVTLDVSNPDSETTYTWDIDGNEEIGSSVTYDLGSPGTYMINLTANNGCDNNEGSDSEEICIGIPSSSIGDIQGENSLTSDDLPVTYSVESVASASYNWSVPATWIYSGEETNELTVTSIDGSGSVSVNVSSSCTTPAISRTMDVVYSESISSIAITANQDDEDGITGSVTYEGGNSNDEITWVITDVNDPSNSVTTTGASINEILEDGTYNVCVTVENNVTSNNDCKEVSIANECDPKLGTIGTITGDDVACEGSEVSLSIAEVANADSYTWSTTSGSITGTGTSATLIASSDAVVTLEVENACGTKDASKTVTFEAAPEADFTYDISEGTATFNATGVNTGYSYSWDFGSGASPTTGIGASPSSVTYATFGEKTVTLTVSSNVCTTPDVETKTITVSECDNPVAPITSMSTEGMPANGCINSFTIVTFTVEPGADDNADHYVWEFPDGTVVNDGKSSYQSTYSYGSGDLTVTAVGSCDEQTYTMPITVGSAPTVPNSLFSYDVESVDYVATATFAADEYNENLTYVWRESINGETSTEVEFGAGGEVETKDYTEPGSYQICLEASNECGVQESCRPVNVKVTALEDELNDYTTSVYPTMTATDFVVELGGNLSGEFDVVISNMIGNEVQRGVMRGGDAEVFDISELPAGMYMITILRGDTQFTQRVMKR